MLRPDGRGWKCHACGETGDALDLAALILAGQRLRELDREAKRRVASRLGARETNPAPLAPRAATPSRSRAFAQDVGALWASAVPVDQHSAAQAWLARRSLPVDAVVALDLARGLTGRSRSPDWAMSGQRTWREEWPLVSPAFDHRGDLASLKARWIAARSPPNNRKSLAPRGDGTASGVVLACPQAQAMLREGGVPACWPAHRPFRLLIGEGEPDFLTWATRWPPKDPLAAVIGVWSGAFTQEIADRIPDDTLVIIRTHLDRGGHELAATAARFLGDRVTLLRRTAEPDLVKLDDNDLLQRGLLPDDPGDDAVPFEPPTATKHRPPQELRFFNHTDSGNAERYRARHGHDSGYVHTWQSWIHFDGTRWRPDGDGFAIRNAIDTLRATAAEAATLEDEGAREALVKHALRSESNQRLGGMLSIAAALLPVSADTLDAHPDLLNVANGTIDLRTGELRPHSRDDWLTQLVPVPYDPSARCPRWEAFLLDVMGGDEQLVAFLQRAIGYSLTGSTSEQVLFLLYGTGANGKSTFITILREALGDYAKTADMSTFLKKDSDAPRNDIARLVGSRFVSALEAEAGRALAEALIKQLTGGDPISARFLYKEFFEFLPQFKIWLAVNHKPGIRNTDHGIWRRIRLVPFTVTIPEAERDKDLMEKLRAELSGILAWAVRGCLNWRQQGLGVPPAVQDATASYRDEMDHVGAFIADRCLVAAELVEVSAALYDAYIHWCQANGEAPRSQKAFGVALGERGHEKRKGAKGVRCWRGLCLRPES